MPQERLTSAMKSKESAKTTEEKLAATLALDAAKAAGAYVILVDVHNLSFVLPRNVLGYLLNVECTCSFS